MQLAVQRFSVLEEARCRVLHLRRYLSAQLRRTMSSLFSPLLYAPTSLSASTHFPTLSYRKNDTTKAKTKDKIIKHVNVFGIISKDVNTSDHLKYNRPDFKLNEQTDCVALSVCVMYSLRYDCCYFTSPSPNVFAIYSKTFIQSFLIMLLANSERLRAFLKHNLAIVSVFIKKVLSYFLMYYPVRFTYKI